MKLAVVAVTRHGIALGERIVAAERDARLYVPAKHRTRSDEPCGVPDEQERDGAAVERDAVPGVQVFSGSLAELVAGIWARHDGFVFVMATGIAVRVIAPHLEDKRLDPGVVVVDVAGRFAISLVAGHAGGANAIARRVAEIIGATPVVTTGTDVTDTIAPDVIAAEIGGEVDDVAAMKAVSAALVDGEATAVVDLTGVDAPSLAGVLKPNVTRLSSLDALRVSTARAAIVITNRLLDDLGIEAPVVAVRPKNLVAGIGCHRGTAADEITGAVEDVLREHRLSPKSLRALATVDARRDETGLLAAAQRLGASIRFCDTATLNAVPGVPNPSGAAMKHVGVQGVAEPAALHVSRGRLLVEKVKRGNVTVAIAEAPSR